MATGTSLSVSHLNNRYMAKRFLKKGDVILEGYAKGLRKAWRVIGEMIEREEAARESAREVGVGEMFRMLTGKKSGRASIRRGWYLILGKTWGRGAIGRCCALSALVLRGGTLTVVGEEDGDTIKVSDADGYIIIRRGFDDGTQVSFQCFDPTNNREVFKVWAMPRFSKLVERGALFD